MKLEIFCHLLICLWQFLKYKNGRQLIFSSSIFMSDSIHLIGAEGFLGKGIQRVARDPNLFSWSHRNPSNRFYFDLRDQSSWINLIKTNLKDNTFLTGLPNYGSDIHLSAYAYIRLINLLIENGCESISVAGTCRYGLQSGALKGPFALII